MLVKLYQRTHNGLNNRSLGIARWLTHASSDTTWQDNTPSHMSHEEYRKSWIDALSTKQQTKIEFPSQRLDRHQSRDTIIRAWINVIQSNPN
ncbi:MAG: hypothetical protein ACON35_08000 [Candidatus Marinamargulisbacteria bacterium]